MSRIRSLFKKEINYEFKIVITGSSGVGKTVLLRRFISGLFGASSSPTLGINVSYKTVKVNDKILGIKCCDIAGTEYFDRFRPGFYNGAQGALLVFDLSNYRSFEELERWLTELNSVIREDIPIILVGNKNDVEINLREVFEEEIETFARRKHLIFYETSAREGINVEEIFYDLIWRMMEKVTPIFQNGKSKSLLDRVLVKELNPKSLELVSTSFCPLCGKNDLLTGQHRQIKDKWLICLNCKNRIH